MDADDGIDAKDPFGTLRNALWIGGGQWAGKSTVARLLVARYAVTAYHYDYSDARSHDDRRVAARARAGQPLAGPDPDSMWVTSSPSDMAERVLAEFPARFRWALDDLRALVSARPIIAEGWGLRPELVASVADSPRRMILLVPTDEFRQCQTRQLERAGRISAPVSDPDRAQRNRLERDRLLTHDAVQSAERLGIRVIEIDGSSDAVQVADLVADHWAPYLRRLRGDPSGPRLRRR